MKIYPLLIAIGLAAAMIGARVALSGPGFFLSPSVVGGAVLIGEPRVLATKGLHRFTRDLMCLGMLLGLPAKEVSPQDITVSGFSLGSMTTLVASE